MCGQSLRKVSQGVLELLIGNEKVTDGQTDRPTWTKQYALSSSKGGIKRFMTIKNLAYRRKYKKQKEDS